MTAAREGKCKKYLNDLCLSIIMTQNSSECNLLLINVKILNELIPKIVVCTWYINHTGSDAVILEPVFYLSQI